MEENYLEELNDSQREAVLYNEGPSLVIAGAGSGKTRVLTYKIAYLLGMGLKPWNILALTFTNKAAKEMKERISRLVGDELAPGLWMGTFHSIFSRILRMEAEHIGYSSRFTIYDQADSRNLLKTIIREMSLDDKVYKLATVAGYISAAKNRLVTPEMYMADSCVYKADQAARIPLTGEIYKRYVARCRQADAMDFDDLLLYTYLLFKHHPDVLQRYAERFGFVLVDEYQDTNYAQHCIVWQLTRNHQRVCVVGDDAQSIYSFRGANIDNILNFTGQYDNARIFKLEQNYRSTQTIVEAANSLISHNNRQIRKNVFSEKEKGTPIQVFEAYSDLEEADIVINKVSELHRKEDIAYDEFAILYRTNAQSRTFEEALRKRNIPYRIYGGLSFYQRKEIKDVIAYCRLAVNPNDEEAFKRVVNYPKRGIGDTTVNKITEAAAGQGVSLWDVACRPDSHGLALNKGTQAKLTSFTSLIEGFIKKVEDTDAASLMMEIIQESRIMNDIFQDSSPEGMSRQENVQELLSGVQAFVAMRQEAGDVRAVYLTDFLQEVSLLSDLDEDDGNDAHKVTLMTIHSAKGLEFRAVFVVGMEENLFPNPMAGGNIREMEEERRLFYVAMTRAEQYCFLSYARSRYRYGKTEFSIPSRFLQDIDPCYLDMGQDKSFFGISGRRSFSGMEAEEHRGQYRRSQSAYDMEKSGILVRTTAHVTGLKPLGVIKKVVPSAATSIASPKPSSPVASTPSGLGVGQMIEHERFGIGKVIKVEGNGENAKATVEFRNTGTKQLLLRFARFKIIG